MGTRAISFAVAGTLLAGTLEACGRDSPAADELGLDVKVERYPNSVTLGLINLLRARVRYQTSELDSAIRFFTRQFCRSWSERYAIEELYDLSVLAQARLVDECGELILTDGSSRCGAAPLARGVCIPRGPVVQQP
jgi:hypothetical protein